MVTATRLAVEEEVYSTAERAMAMEMKRVMAMAKNRMIACKSDGDGNEDSDGEQQ